MLCQRVTFLFGLVWQNCDRKSDPKRMHVSHCYFSMIGVWQHIFVKDSRSMTSNILFFPCSFVSLSCWSWGRLFCYYLSKTLEQWECATIWQLSQACQVLLKCMPLIKLFLMCWVPIGMCWLWGCFLFIFITDSNTVLKRYDKNWLQWLFSFSSINKYNRIQKTHSVHTEKLAGLCRAMNYFCCPLWVGLALSVV